MYCAHYDCLIAEDFIALEIVTNKTKVRSIYYLDKINSSEWFDQGFEFNITNSNDSFKVSYKISRVIFTRSVFD